MREINFGVKFLIPLFKEDCKTIFEVTNLLVI